MDHSDSGKLLNPSQGGVKSIALCYSFFPQINNFKSDKINCYTSHSLDNPTLSKT